MNYSARGYREADDAWRIVRIGTSNAHVTVTIEGAGEAAAVSSGRRCAAITPRQARRLARALSEHARYAEQQGTP